MIFLIRRLLAYWNLGNHSLHYQDPVTGVHTNSIEGYWSGLKRRTPIRHRTEAKMTSVLLKDIWMKQEANCLWDSFLYKFYEIVIEPIENYIKKMNFINILNGCIESN